MVKILGLDVSYSATGYYYSDTGYGVIKSSPKMVRMERIKYIVKQIQGLLATVSPDFVVLENYSFNSKNDREMAGELGGHVRMAIYDRKIPIYMVPPTSLKKFISGKGNASKQQVMRAIREKHNKDFSNDNIADAFALWKMGNELGTHGLRVLLDPKNFIGV